MLTLYQMCYTIYGTFTFGDKNSFVKLNATKRKIQLKKNWLQDFSYSQFNYLLNYFISDSVTSWTPRLNPFMNDCFSSSLHNSSAQSCIFSYRSFCSSVSVDNNFSWLLEYNRSKSLYLSLPRIIFSHGLILPKYKSSIVFICCTPFMQHKHIPQRVPIVQIKNYYYINSWMTIFQSL